MPNPEKAFHNIGDLRMKYFIFILLIILLCLGIFFLPTNRIADKSTDKPGTKSEVQIHKKPLPGKLSSKLQDKLNNIIINHLEFEDASIFAVVNLLRAEAKEMDLDKKGINIVLLLGNDSGEREMDEDEEEDFLRDDDTEDEDLIVDAENTGERTITIMFDDLSLGEAIRNICIAADMNYRVEEYAVVIASKNVALDNLETRIYPVEQDAFAEMGAEEVENGATTSVKDYFIRRGIAFPGEARIVYDNSISRLIATNTTENLRKIEWIIDELNVIDPQVLITSRFIKIPETEYRKIKRIYNSLSSANPSKSIWNKLLSSKSTEIIASATVLTQNGEEACIRMVREVYLPESWGEGGSAPAKNDNNDNNDDKEDAKDDDKEIKKSYPPSGQILSSTAMPEFGAPTELGIRLVVTPTVDPDKYTISLDAIPVIQYLIGWTYHSNGVRMPVIKAWTNQSQHTSYDGYTIMAASTLEDVYDKSTKTRLKNRFILLLTARLVLPDGTELRNGTQTLPVHSQTVQPAIPESSLNPTEKKLSELTLTHMNFTDVNIQTILKYLGEELHNHGENIQIALGVTEEDLANVPAITLNLENIPFSDVIRYICLKAGLEYRIKDNNVLIDEECDPFETRFFNCRAALIYRIAPVRGRARGVRMHDQKPDDRLKAFMAKQGVLLPLGSKVSFNPATGRYTVDSTATKFEDYPAPVYNPITSEVLKAYFSERGVPFPSGSSIGYDKRGGQLVVRNTSDNLRRLGGLLRCLDLDQPQVIVESTIVEIGNEELIKLIGKEAALADNLSTGQIEKIITSEAGRVLASQELMSKSGEEAIARLVNETYFPESWTEPELASSEAAIFPTDSYPEFGEPADIGARFIVTPTVSPNNYTIYLNISPRILKLLGWSKYEPTMTIDLGKSVKRSSSKVAMPKTSLKDLNSNIRIYHGTTILAGKTQLLDFPNVKKDSMNPNTSWTAFLKKSKESGNRSKNLFFFIKATIVNPDGEGI